MKYLKLRREELGEKYLDIIPIREGYRWCHTGFESGDMFFSISGSIATWISNPQDDSVVWAC
jgi:hypothetical protein